MVTNDATGKEARQAAYAAYVACFWSLRRLPPGDTRRPALALATQQAESVWRVLMNKSLARDHVVCHHRPIERRPRLLVALLIPEMPHGGESLSAADH